MSILNVENRRGSIETRPNDLRCASRTRTVWMQTHWNSYSARIKKTRILWKANASYRQSQLQQYSRACTEGTIQHDQSIQKYLIASVDDSCFAFEARPSEADLHICSSSTTDTTIRQYSCLSFLAKPFGSHWGFIFKFAHCNKHFWNFLVFAESTNQILRDH
jgi:hypothetical protein